VPSTTSAAGAGLVVARRLVWRIVVASKSALAPWRCRSRRRFDVALGIVGESAVVNELDTTRNVGPRRRRPRAEVMLLSNVE